MKLVIMYMEPRKLNALKKLLYAKDIKRFSVSDAFGHSDKPGIIESYRGVEMEIDLLKKVRIEVAVNDDFLDILVSSLLEEGKAGRLGEGKLFVLPVENCYRLATGEEGSAAIG